MTDTLNSVFPDWKVSNPTQTSVRIKKEPDITRQVIFSTRIFSNPDGNYFVDQDLPF
jgi:hypothetical protein